MIKECALIGQSMTAKTTKDSAISISMFYSQCALSLKTRYGEQRPKKFMNLMKTASVFPSLTKRQVSRKHLRKISDRTALQSADNAEKFITKRKIDSFESLANFTADKEQRYRELETVHLSKGQKLNRLKELSKMYALFAPIQATYKESQSLKGFAKMKYDKEHKDSLSKYPELKERMQSLLQNGEKITPKQWKAEIQSLQSEYDSIGKEQTKTATELAYAEVISYNKKP